MRVRRKFNAAPVQPVLALVVFLAAATVACDSGAPNGAAPTPTPTAAPKDTRAGPPEDTRDRHPPPRGEPLHVHFPGRSSHWMAWTRVPGITATSLAGIKEQGIACAE